MKRINDVLNEIDQSIDQHVLEDFIARGWVRPLMDETDYLFDEIDISRVHFICDLHVKMTFDVDAMDVILSLMDQLYQNKMHLNQMMSAIENQPNDVRNAIIKSFQEIE